MTLIDDYIRLERTDRSNQVEISYNPPRIASRARDTVCGENLDTYIFKPVLRI